MKLITTLILILTGLTSAWSCGNEYGYTLDGRIVHTQYFYLSSKMKSFNITQVNERLEHLRQKVAAYPNDYKAWSDLAANLLKVGKADSAIKILTPWIAKMPNEYNLNANLGTAYELTGNLDSALKYISKGYSLNKNSHFNSEWVHIKILEAKIKERARPGWIRINRILNVDSLIARADTANRRRRSVFPGVTEVSRQIMFQVRTRAPFTPAPNQVITNLLLSLGTLNEQVGTYENALLSYAYALEFTKEGYQKRQIKEAIKSLNRKRDANPNLHELPDFFLSVVKRSELDPDLLLMGIDDFADQLDSMHIADIEKEDSINQLKHMVDSLSELNKEEVAKGKETPTTSRTPTVIAIIIGVFIGMGLMFLFMWKRRKS